MEHLQLIGQLDIPYLPKSSRVLDYKGNCVLLWAVVIMCILKNGWVPVWVPTGSKWSKEWRKPTQYLIPWASVEPAILPTVLFRELGMATPDWPGQGENRFC